MRLLPQATPRLRGIATKFLGYFLTAGMAAIVDTSGFAVLMRAAVPLALAAMLSFGVAAVVNYLLTSRIVFQRRPTFKGFGAFLMGALVGFAINVGVTILAATQFNLSPVLAKVLGVGLAFFANFLINLLIVFR